MPQIDLSAWRENVQGCQIGGRHVRVGESAFPSPCTSCVCSTEGVCELKSYSISIIIIVEIYFFNVI